MEVSVGKSRIFLWFGSRAEKEEVIDATSIKDPKAHQIKTYSKSPTIHEWDGYIRYAKEQKDGDDSYWILPIGFLRRIKDICKKNGFPLELDDQREFTPIPYSEDVKGITLDDEQVKICKIFLSNPFCSAQIGTGSGKTEIQINCVSNFLKARPEDKVVIVVPLKSLLKQTVDRFKTRLPTYSNRIGRLGDGFKEHDKQIVIAIANTACVNKNIKNPEEILADLKQTNLLILDETHHAISEMWQKVIANCNPDVMWAMSGKIVYHSASEKDTEMKIESVIGMPFYEGKVESRLCPIEIRNYHYSSWDKARVSPNIKPKLVDDTMVKYGYENGRWKTGRYRGPDKDGIPPKICMSWCDKRSGWVADKKKYGIYNDEDEQQQVEKGSYIYYTVHDLGIMEFKPRNKWCIDLGITLANKEEQFIISTSRVRHARKIYERFRKIGVDVGLLLGGEGKEQQQVLDDFNAGNYIGIVSSYQIISEGIDLPNVIHFIKMDGMKGEQILEQQKGRIERKAEGKEKGIMHIPRDTQHPTLERNTGKMMGYYTKRGFKITRLKFD